MNRIVAVPLFIIAFLVSLVAWEVRREIAAEEKQAKQALALEPPQAGVYYKAPDGWSRVPPVIFYRTGPKYTGKSPLQIKERRPVFYVKQVPLPDTMAALRSFQSPVVWTIVGFDKSGISSRRLPRIVRTPISQTCFSITPAADLAPGQYLLTNMGVSGFDFGVR